MSAGPGAALGGLAGLRLACFAAVLGATACAERLRPRRPPTVTSLPRWRVNLLLMAAGAVLTRLVFPAAAVGAAVWARENGVGLLNRGAWPPAVGAALAVAWLDLVVYWQHRLFHRVPLLWRFHAVHHTDLDLDASSGVRFHPFEIVFSMAVKMAAVVLSGASPLAVVFFEILLNATAVFNHGNLAIPPAADAFLRIFLVTPDMHRVHHTTRVDEQNTNFGFNAPWWDRLFGTYRDQPREGHAGALLGLRDARDPAALGLLALLARPFRSSAVA
ncbi:MAG: sterol desaturase family protein [Elusimicrobia bacterium]|nr:sterol desaturase family protein [Elusimicrobiota bacterium]